MVLGMTVGSILMAVEPAGTPAGAPTSGESQAGLPVTAGLLIDLNADSGVEVDPDGFVSAWRNQAGNQRIPVFTQRDLGRKIPGSGRPKLVADGLPGHRTLQFVYQELVCLAEGADTELQPLITGAGFTWFTVLKAYPLRPTRYIHAWFGNLRNTTQTKQGHYEGFWAGFDDDLTVWMAVRNGRTFGWPDVNNPKLIGPRLTDGQFHLLAGRMQAGTGSVELGFWLDGRRLATANLPVEVQARSSFPAIGQERDAINHPGLESFAGEIARHLIYRGSLGDADMAAVTTYAQAAYGLKSASEPIPTGK